jgi:hypothetical protein
VNVQHEPEKPFVRQATSPNAADDQASNSPTLVDRLNLLLKHFQELSEYFLKLLTTTVDDLTLSLRSIIVWLALAAIGFVAIAGVIVIASWLLLSGMAEGLGGLFGRAWAGRLVTGLIPLAGLGLVLYCILLTRNRTARRRSAERS